MSESISDLSARLDPVLKKLGNCVALIEDAVHRIETHELVSGKRLEASENYFQLQIKGIRSAITELQGFMDETGAARMRIAMENAMKQGDSHLMSIKQATEEFRKLSEAACSKLQTVADNSSKVIFNAVEAMDVKDFRRIALESTQHVQKTSHYAVNRVQTLVKRFHWEKLGLAAFMAVSVSLLTALFVNDEAPWESHKHVVAERQAGHMLYQVWPNLSATEKAHIQSVATKYL